MENNKDVYELLDMGFGKCRLMVAVPEAKLRPNLTDYANLRVATKFPNIAQDYFDRQGMQMEFIKLNGSIELAPILGLSDVIVDIVETGKTLKENDLEVMEEIVPISARLIANQAAYQFQYDAIRTLVRNLEEQL